MRSLGSDTSLSEALGSGITTARQVIESIGPERGAWAILATAAFAPEPSDHLLVVWLAQETGGLRDEMFEELDAQFAHGTSWPERCAKMAQKLGHLTADGHATASGLEAVAAFMGSPAASPSASGVGQLAGG